MLSFISLFTFTVIFGLSTATTYNGCLEVDNSGTCLTCYLSKATFDSGCGPMLPPSNHCRFWRYSTFDDDSYCVEAKYGYALVKSDDFGSRKIVNGPLDDCISQVKDTLNGNTYQCIMCDHYKYPFLDLRTKNTVCVKPNDDRLRPQDKIKIIPNCKYGGSVSYNNGYQSTCMRCDPGYAIDGPNGQKCVTPNKRGCLRNASFGDCLECDVYSGYSMNADGNCFQA